MAQEKTLREKSIAWWNTLTANKKSELSNEYYKETVNYNFTSLTGREIETIWTAEEGLGKEEKTFTLFWLDGKSELVKGTDASSAMNNAGIGQGALRAMDFYAEGDQRENYAWDSGAKNWERINIETEK